QLGEMGEGLGKLFEQVFSKGIVPTGLISGIIALVVGLACLGLLLVVALTIARYVAENGLIKMVDDYEATSEQRSVKEGFRMSWSRAAFRQWLIDLVITLPIVVAVILSIALSLTPLLAWTTGNTTAGIFGTVAAIGLFFLVILAAIVVGTIAGLVEKLAFRATSLEDLGVFPSIGRAVQLLRENLKDVGLMWLIMFGIGLAFTVLMIPVVLLTLIIAGVACGLLFLGVSGVAGLFFSGIARWIIGSIIGLAVFVLLVIIPLTFIGGLYEVYKSSVWTLSYRELTALASLADENEPEVHTEAAATEEETDDSDTTE
ncbi:MAG: hypothetical protein MUQ30_11870, partial [Anaerolineae bacterium]|nr:hypothetical protein [Anaerolineae bacterium]